jgi:hypothetical protein
MRPKTFAIIAKLNSIQGLLYDLLELYIARPTPKSEQEIKIEKKISLRLRNIAYQKKLYEEQRRQIGLAKKAAL